MSLKPQNQFAYECPIFIQKNTFCYSGKIHSLKFYITFFLPPLFRLDQGFSPWHITFDGNIAYKDAKRVLWLREIGQSIQSFPQFLNTLKMLDFLLACAYFAVLGKFMNKIYFPRIGRKMYTIKHNIHSEEILCFILENNIHYWMVFIDVFIMFSRLIQSYSCHRVFINESENVRKNCSHSHQQIRRKSQFYIS